jgi:PAS domain S-box-containing protein
MLNRARAWIRLGLLAMLTGVIAALHRDKEHYRQTHTELRQMQAALENRQRFIEQIAVAAPSIIYVYDLIENRSVWVNREITTLLGYPSTDIRAMGSNLFLKILVPEDAVLLDKRNQRLQTVADGEVVITEYRARHKNGEIRWFHSRDVVLNRTADGKPRRVLGVAVDITERRVAEERARLLQELTSLLAQAMTPQAIAEIVVKRVLRSFGGHLATIVLANESGDAIEIMNTVGLPELIATNFKTTPLSFPLPLTDAVRTGQPVVIETQEDYVQRYPNFEDYLHTITRSHANITLPLRDLDRIIGAIGFSFPEDRTFSPEDLALYEAIAQQCAQAIVRVQLYEAERQARQRAERADQIKLKFLGMVSHELRTPLTSIKGFATTLLADDVVFTPEQQQQFLEIISQESDKLTDLVEQLLNLTQLNAGNLMIVPHCQRFAALMDAAVPQFKLMSNNHILTVDYTPDLPMVMADTRRIMQVLTNLIGNAVKFSPPDTHVRVSAYSADDGVQVEITDEGPGIPVEAHAYVFEAFRQAENNTLLHHRGAGLGLAICKGLIESHGGRIWIKSSEERGTTIAFWLPAAKQGECPG